MNASGAGRAAVVPGTLCFGTRQQVLKMKKSSPEKTYTIRFRLGSPRTSRDGQSKALAGQGGVESLTSTSSSSTSSHLLRDVAALAGAELSQRTPLRVAHRRPDLVRKRIVRSVTFRNLSVPPTLWDDGAGTTLPQDCEEAGEGCVPAELGEEIELVIRAESGTYIKEFVTGDRGRTTPSVASVLGRDCHVLWLDVNDIHDYEDEDEEAQLEESEEDKGQN